MSLPTIEMPKKEPAVQEDPSKNISTDTGDIIYYDSNEDDSGEDQEELLPSLDPPSHPHGEEIIKVEEEEVFNSPPPATSQQISEIPEPKKTGKRAYNRKKPMSQKQLDHLAKIRAIGAEKRKVRAQETREKKLLDQEKDAEERLLKKKEKAEEKKIVDDFKTARDYKEKKLQEDYENQKPKKVNEVPNGYFTRDDLDTAVLRAVETYDTKRKKEKKIKKKKQAEDAVEQKKISVIQNAIQPQTIQNDPWRQFFQ